jgi:hypothetical protein
VALLAAFTLLLHLSLAPNVGDLDSFYHIGHAAAYLENGLFDTGLPWATQSVIADEGADLWWGFHVVLLPFAAGDPAWGIRVAGLVLTLLLAGAVGWVVRRHGVGSPDVWIFVFLVAVPNILFRYLMVRPHVLSLALSLLLVSFLIKGRWWQAGLAAALTVWLHLSLAWMPMGLLAAYGLSRLLVRHTESVPMRQAVPAVVGGVLLGALLRPMPLASLRLAWIQIAELFALKGADTPLLFAGELIPLPAGELLVTSWLYLALWLLALGVLGLLVVRGRLRDLPGDAAAMMLVMAMVSAVFLALTLGSARRAQVEWVAFGVVMLPLLWTFALPVERRRPLLAAALLLAVVHLPWAIHRHRLNVRFASFPATTLAEAAEWLEANTEVGSVVFHARWDNFGPLLAHNRANRYLSGMDPVFQFAHDPQRYWEFFWLSSDIHDEWTCDAFPCHAGTATDTHTVLRDHFGADWVLVQPTRNPKLTLYLLNDPRYTLALETAHEAVFQVLAGDDGGLTAEAAERVPVSP